MYWYIKVLKNYIKFSGRASRKEFWSFIIIDLLVFILLFILDDWLGLYTAKVYNAMIIKYGYLEIGYSVLTICPTICVNIRRLHDIGKSGYWYLVGYIPILGIYVLVLLLTDGTKEKNQYGDVPEKKHKKKKTLTKQKSIDSVRPAVKQNHHSNTYKSDVPKSKFRFCKYCGSRIDAQSKKCTGCGKQYFHISGLAAGIGMIVFAFAVMIVLLALALNGAI